MSEDLEHENRALRAELAALRRQTDVATRRAARALASHQQHALTMELIRQKNADLDRLTGDLEAARAEEAQRAVELAATNLRLRDVVAQLSTPILSLGRDTLALPLIGVLDESRAIAITTRTLDEVHARSARHVVLDLTGVETMDAPTFGHLLRLVRAVRLLGARCLFCGLRPTVASILADHADAPDSLEALCDLGAALAVIARGARPTRQS